MYSPPGTPAAGMVAGKAPEPVRSGPCPARACTHCGARSRTGHRNACAAWWFRGSAMVVRWTAPDSAGRARGEQCVILRSRRRGTHQNDEVRAGDEGSGGSGPSVSPTRRASPHPQIPRAHNLLCRCDFRCVRPQDDQCVFADCKIPLSAGDPHPLLQLLKTAAADLQARLRPRRHPGGHAAGRDPGGQRAHRAGDAAQRRGAGGPSGVPGPPGRAGAARGGPGAAARGRPWRSPPRGSGTGRGWPRWWRSRRPAPRRCRPPVPWSPPSTTWSSSVR
jgi:hypothetical protein